MAFVYPSITYACETWTMLAEDRRRLDVWWMKQVRQIYGVTLFDHVESDVILENLGASKLSDIIRRRRMNYFGHLYRYPDSRWAKYLMYAKKHDQVNEGRKLIWIKQIKSDILEYDLDTSLIKIHDIIVG